MPFIRKRAAQLFSKSRFIAAQFDAYLEGWPLARPRPPRQRMADRLRAGIGASNSARLAWPTASNEVFASSRKTCGKDRPRGRVFYEWPVPAARRNWWARTKTLIRLVTSFATRGDVDGFLGCLAS
jgi:threonine aldolase